ncbi:hypothetical protein DICVIV_03391 [Dictyocaulus viviparus]|uniref:Thrombospondin type 1 domain protein n=1 Tax=Dictyocaulus viviparus TaxID=29172 RepID=A0A0D8Y366_DICVI|nr:hypothetical protein DICVIV_03391 [Dictyocaulus viviparus]
MLNLKHDSSDDPVIKAEKQTIDGRMNTSQGTVQWSEWSTCNCAVQSRKSICLPIDQMVSHTSQPLIDYRQRQRRASTMCSPPVYETRACHSDRCQL